MNAEEQLLHEAILRVIDDGDPTRYSSKGKLGAAWLINDLDEVYANEKRLRFCDAVIECWRKFKQTDADQQANDRR